MEETVPLCLTKMCAKILLHNFTFAQLNMLEFCTLHCKPKGLKMGYLKDLQKYLDMQKHMNIFSKPYKGVNFINMFTHSFYAHSSPKRKNSVKSSVSFYAFWIYVRKSCM